MAGEESWLIKNKENFELTCNLNKKHSQHHQFNFLASKSGL